MVIVAVQPTQVRQLLISRPALPRAFPHKLRVSSALGFPSKTSAEITPDHRKLSRYIFRVQRKATRKPASALQFATIDGIFTMPLKMGGIDSPSRHHDFPATPTPPLVAARHSD